MVGGVAALLNIRSALGAGILAALVAYYAVVDRLATLPTWADTALVALALMPAVFALVLLALPLRASRGLLPVALALTALAATADAAGLDVASNFAKLAAASLLGFWFLAYFERLAWVVLVAALIPFVDAISVWRGPTRHIVSERPDVFGALSFAFPLPGAGSFQLGVTDLLFFALFLGAAARFALRVTWTWLALVVSLAVTVALTVLGPFGSSRLPALPGLSLGFLAANADLVRRRLRGDEDDRSIAVTLDVRNLDTSLRFYWEVLGVRAAQADDDSSVVVFVAWATDGPGGTELVIPARDLEVVHERAVEAGTQVIEVPRDHRSGRRARYRDPDGNLVTLVERR